MKFLNQVLSFIAFIILTALAIALVSAAVGAASYYLYLWAEQSGLVEALFAQFIKESIPV